MRGDEFEFARSLVGVSASMQRLYSLIMRVSQHGCPVLIRGETGTGKELVARLIHSLGPRKEQPFVPVDCASLSSTLMETELFGHEKDAFTDAHHARQGLLASAGNGTIFLDEIGELPLAMQPKLLRALQEKEFRPVGSVRYASFNARIIAATHRDLETEMKNRTFREDLYFRLNVASLEIPPLRERTSDIALLVQAFLKEYREPGSHIEISDAAMKFLQAYDWPGNVRELENAVMRGLALCSGTLIEPQHFDLHGESIGQPKRAYEPRSIKELKDHAAVCALRATSGDKAAAARLLGIGKTTLYRKLKVMRAIASVLLFGLIISHPN